MKTTPTIIKTAGLKKHYTANGQTTAALSGVDIEIARGEFVAIMGPSGCGKSTLLNILGLLDSPTSGQVWFDDRDVSSLAEKQRVALRKANIGYVFQSFNLIDELTVYENIELPLIYLKHSRDERKNRVNEVLQQMRIMNRKDHFPQQLSGGQQQRVAVARAVVVRPQMILADEPTGNLDSANGHEVMSLLSSLSNVGTTIVMVTHSQSDADYASRVIELLDGQVLAEKNTVSKNAII